MENYKGVISNEIIKEFPSEFPDNSFFNYVSNYVELERLIGVAGLLCPEFVKDEDHIFLFDPYKRLEGAELDWLKKEFEKRRDREEYVNAISLSEFFLLSYRPDMVERESIHKPKLVEAFGEILEHFWGQRLNKSFPEKSFCFRRGNDIHHQYGKCITFCQE